VAEVEEAGKEGEVQLRAERNKIPVHFAVGLN
jgi:hypothetical protein